MYQIILLILFTLIFKINTDVIQEHKSLNLNYNDLYSQCDQHGGHRLCLGTLAKENENFKLSKSDCVKYKNCIMLFQFEIVNSLDSMNTATGEHCLYFDKQYKDQITRNNFRDQTVLLGVRFGYEPISVKLESTCFLGESIDFLQVYYPDKRENLARIKNGAAFDPAFITYDNQPIDNNPIYCCFKQPLRIKVSNRTLSNELNEIIEIILDKKIYLSYYYQIGSLNNTLKMIQPFNLLEYNKRSNLFLTSPSTTTTTTTSTESTSSTENKENTDNRFTTQSSYTTLSETSSDFDLTSTTSKPTLLDPVHPTTLPPSVEESKEAENKPGKVLIIFVLSVVLLVFFLLIAITIYNLLMK